MNDPIDRLNDPVEETRWPGPVTVVGGVVLCVGGLTAASVWGQAHAGLLWLDLPVAVVAVATAVAQLRWPVAGALAATALTLLSPVATPAASQGALQVAQCRRLPLATGVAAAGFAAHLGQAVWRPNSGISLGWWLLLVGVAYGALVGWGQWARSRRALLLSLRERALRAEAEQGRRVAEARLAERRRLAREMHDVLAHRLTLVATFAGALEYRPDSSPERLAQAAGVVRSGVHQALEELRQVIGLLRDEEEEGDEGAGAGATRPGLGALPVLVGEAGQVGQRVRLREETSGGAPPAGAARAAYRVAQEGLTNARKHAPGRPVELRVAGRPGERLVVEVSNPLPPPAGAGDAEVPGWAGTGAGAGLVGLGERVRLAGGELEHTASDGEFRLRASLPWPA
ncbi:Signal transduction histidine kinase [Streptomyces zhaozhouensis]|uniref:histidine kinase n=1 Tax=Streptomyces zhaozhouensis TaxID=1300267 RepID=A0A286DJU7_9ACTN|nr:histidine kinase [Streptomyces zhaozhouensis]SOD59027.1 Signal transduction histidine kinase [Streptomyces zhaozhouensis]